MGSKPWYQFRGWWPAPLALSKVPSTQTANVMRRAHLVERRDTSFVHSARMT